MNNQYYQRQASLASRTKAKGDQIKSELDAVSAAFDKLPQPNNDGTGFSVAVKVAEATEPSQAVTKGQLDTLIGSNTQNKEITLASKVATEAARDIALDAKTIAVTHKGFAVEWSIKGENQPVSAAAGGDGSTLYSAFHWAQKAKASALAAALFDPSSYYVKNDIDAKLAINKVSAITPSILFATLSLS